MLPVATMATIIRASPAISGVPAKPPSWACFDFNAAVPVGQDKVR